VAEESLTLAWPLPFAFPEASLEAASLPALLAFAGDASGHGKKEAGSLRLPALVTVDATGGGLAGATGGLAASASGLAVSAA
jgi:hypothetical protein